ncbi:protein GPR15LG [Equus quagga]|uniref:protein GPR15LG n=1 Tax=Equus quagga TaxID=89248 RepID=UPI001EE26A09|nr:protein GPR15LG [Equus quagga]
MRFPVLLSLLCILLLCFSIFSAEGRRPRPRPKPGKVRPCCTPDGTPVQGNPKGHPSRICRPCKFKPEARWVVPGALPQV